MTENKQTTALQELIERVKSLYTKGHDDAGLRTCEQIATELLAKEQKCIIDAWEDGYYSEWENEETNASKYYTKTYKP